MSSIRAYKQQESETNKEHLSHISLFTGKPLDRVKACCDIQVYMQGDTFLKEGDEPHHFYIVKHGQVKVEKKIKVQKKNYWPVGVRQWESQITEQKVQKHIKTLEEGQFVCESEIIKQEQFPVTLSALSSPTILISISRKKFLELFPIQERDEVLRSPDLITFPSEEEVLRKREVGGQTKSLTKSALYTAAKINDMPQCY